MARLKYLISLKFHETPFEKRNEKARYCNKYAELCLDLNPTSTFCICAVDPRRDAEYLTVSWWGFLGEVDPQRGSAPALLGTEALFSGTVAEMAEGKGLAAPWTPTLILFKSSASSGSHRRFESCPCLQLAEATRSLVTPYRASASGAEIV